MKLISRNRSFLLLGALSLFAMTSCGSSTPASTSFIFQASTFYEGTTYKLNLKGMSDQSCTLVCDQAETPLNLSGKWTFDNNSGYSFDFGEDQRILSGYNSYSKNHYVNYTLDLTSSVSIRLMMTYADSSFTPSSSYVDPYDVASGVTLYTGNSVTTEEEIKFRDFGDGTFDVISFGSSEIFDYGTYSDDNGTRTYTFSDGTTAERESGLGSNNYRVIYTTYSQSFFGQTAYQNELYHLSGDMTLDEAFPDPRGSVMYEFTGTNKEEFVNMVTTYAAGSVNADLTLYKNDTTSSYELSIILDGDSWYSETGTWIEENTTLTFTSEDATVPSWTGSSTGNFDYTITKSSFFGDPTVVVFHFDLAA